MAAHSFWKGYLKLSLVTCRVAMTPAVSENDKVRFHTLNRKTGHRIVSRYVDAASGKPVKEDDEVRGYQRGEDDYVLLEDDELDAVALESARAIDIEKFAPADSIEWIWCDRPHYLMPDDKVAEEAFCVIRDAMASTATVGIARLVLYRRERAVMLKPRDKGIELWTLRYGDEIRDESEYFQRIGSAKPDSKQMALLTKLIKTRSKAWNPDMVSDPVQARLLDIIAEKKKGPKRPTKAKAETEPPPSNVINIMDALRKSIASETKAPKRK